MIHIYYYSSVIRQWYFRLLWT